MKKLLKSPEKLSKYLLSAIIIFVALMPKFPFIAVPGTFVSIRLEDFLLAVSLFYITLLIIKKRLLFEKDVVIKRMLLYLMFGALSVSSAVVITKTIPFHIGILHWIRRIEYFLPFLIGFLIMKKGNINLDFVFKLILIVVAVAFIFGLGQRYLSWPIIITQNQEYSKGVALRWMEGSHINSTFAGHYDLASFLVLVLPMIVIAFFVVKGKYSRLFILFSYFGGMWLLTNSASRISLFSYLISVVLGLILVKRIKVIPIVVVVSILCTVMSTNLQERYLRLIQVSISKIQKVSDIVQPVFAEDKSFPEKRKIVVTPTLVPKFEDRSTNIRLAVEWPRAMRAFAKNPLLGTGYSSITLATDNDYFRALGETGILGFISFILIIITLGIRFIENIPYNKKFDGINLVFISGISSSLIGILINALFIDVFEASKFAIIFWLLVGCAYGQLKKEYA